MSSPNSSDDIRRRALENILAPIAGCLCLLDGVYERQYHRMRTDDERYDVQTLIEIKRQLKIFRDAVAQYHPDHETREVQR